MSSAAYLAGLARVSICLAAELFQREMLSGPLKSTTYTVIKLISLQSPHVHWKKADRALPAGYDGALRIDGHRVELCDRFEGSEAVQRLFRAALAEAGVVLDETCWDRVRLRVQPSGGAVDDVSATNTASGKYSCTLPLHRDTWGSNVMAQINWWAPLLPLEPGATLELYPSYFTKPVANTSSQWDFEELKACRKRHEAYPQMPVVVGDAVNRDDDAEPVLIEVGDLIAFSGAHLHASAINRTGRTRFSTEVRTVDRRDFAEGWGAPNVDGAAPQVTRQWFTGIGGAGAGVRL